MINKKPTKTIDKTKPEHRKTSAKKVKEEIAAPVKTASVYIKSSQDTGWKRLITKHFESFLEFFYSDIHKDIDFGKGYEFLDKELQALIPESETGERTADKLVKVWLKSGQEEWLLIHIEIQGKKEERFEERMYIYNSRIFWEYRKEVVTLVILADKNKGFRPEKYESIRWQFRHVMEFPTVKLLDYKDKELEKINNPYSMAVQIHLKLLECGNKIDQKYIWKVTLVRKLLNAGYKPGEIQSLFEFINWLMPLPVDMEKKYVTEVKKGPGGKKMEKLLSNYDKMIIGEDREKMAENLRKLGVSEDKIREAIRMAEQQAA